MRSFDVQPLALFYGAEGDAVGTIADFNALVTRSSARHLVRTAMPEFAEEAPYAELFRQIRKAQPRCLTPVYRDDHDARFEIFAIDAGECR